VVSSNWTKIAATIVRNQAHRVSGGPLRGGNRIARLPSARRREHARGIFEVIRPELRSLAGAVGVEIGPGDNVDVSQMCVEAGARKMYAVDRFAHPIDAPPGVELIHSHVERLTLPEPADFAFSHDVLQHVDDVPATMRRIFTLLRPAGRFVNSIDLRGFGAFADSKRPLDYLRCPDWLWTLMFSHMVNTNRVRASEFKAAALGAGFAILKYEALAVADPDYTTGVRPKLLPRFRDLDTDDLAILQLLLVLEKPEPSPS